MVFAIKEVAVDVEENGQVLDTFRGWSGQGLLIGFRMCGEGWQSTSLEFVN